jgi:hypothetical protein
MANECSVKHFEDRDKCKAYFANYRSCMEFWASEVVLSMLGWIHILKNSTFNTKMISFRQILKLREDEREFVHCYLHLKKGNKFSEMLEVKQSCRKQYLVCCFYCLSSVIKIILYILMVKTFYFIYISIFHNKSEISEYRILVHITGCVIRNLLLNLCLECS